VRRKKKSLGKMSFSGKGTKNFGRNQDRKPALHATRTSPESLKKKSGKRVQKNVPQLSRLELNRPRPNPTWEKRERGNTKGGGSSAESLSDQNPRKSRERPGNGQGLEESKKRRDLEGEELRKKTKTEGLLEGGILSNIGGHLRENWRN